MKIYYIQNMRMPTEKAHGYQIMKTCEALCGRGISVNLYVTDRSTNIKDEPFTYYGIKKAFNIIYCKVLDTINVFPKPISGLGFIIERWSFLLALRKIEFKNVDIIYTRDPWLAWHLKKYIGKPVFLELHALPSLKTLKKCRDLDGVLCLTRWMQDFVDKELEKVPNTWLPDSVDLELFDTKKSKDEARSELNIPNDEKLIVYGGRFSTMEKSKGLALLDESIREAAKEIPNIKLYLIGGDENEFLLYEKSEPSRYTKCIPSVSRDLLALYYKAADVLVMPFPNTYHYAYEMSPLKLFEYMASGTPIVTSDLPSIREVLDEKSALFYPAGNIAILTEKIVELCKNQEKSLIISNNSYKKTSGFTWLKRAENIIEFIS
jgi:glycosyltransferase involved in cell wall biosynthesis